MNRRTHAAQKNVDILGLIESVSAEFRRQWKSGAQPNLDVFLDKVPQDARRNLFCRLLPIDIRYRQRGGEQPQWGEYLHRFPQYQRVIGDAFNITTSASHTDQRTVTRAGTAEISVKINEPAANRIGEYQLLRELGRGGFGVVYEAEHVGRRNRVALKTLPIDFEGQSVNAERLHRFRREFRRLAEINHPNLVGMQTLEVDGNQWFFTMDLIDGVDFFTYVRPSGTLDQSRLRHALNQLVTGVLALHEYGIVHRDLKPSNVLVNAADRLLILDFGLIAELEQRTDQTASVKTQHFAGTPRYAAPEQFLGQRSPATDWYAIGTMLYEAITGSAPFTGSAAELMIKKRECNPPRLSDRSDLPTDLATLTDQLLCRVPEERPSSLSIAAKLSVGFDSGGQASTENPEEEDRVSDSIATDPTQILIGRESQLAELRAAEREFLRERKPSVIWITGLSGEGKSSLADCFLASIRRDGTAQVFAGRCYDRESVPFKAVDVLVEALASFLRSRPRDRVSAWLPPDIQMLATMFPILRRVEPVAERPEPRTADLDDRQVRYRAFFALRELLVNLSLETPIILFIDDLQWGDADSAKVLCDLFTAPHPPAMLFLGSYRSDEAGQSPFLREWNRRSEPQHDRLSGNQVNVAPLSEAECLAFMAHRLGKPADQLGKELQRTFADTKGNPYFLEQMIEGYNAGTERFEPIPLHEILQYKLSRLPNEAEELLQVIATSGQPVAADEASAVAGYDVPLFSTITRMQNERLLRTIGGNDQGLIDTYHDKVRETVLSNLTDSRKQELHLRFAEVLEKQCEVTSQLLLDAIGAGRSVRSLFAPAAVRLYDIAYHFTEADDPRRFAYQLAAGQNALQTYAVDEAISYLEQAKASLPANAPKPVRFQLFEMLGRAYLKDKRADSALESYLSAVDDATSHFERATALAGISSVHRQVSQLNRAIQLAEQALSELGVRFPRSTIGIVFSYSLQSARSLVIPSSWQSAKTESARQLAIMRFQTVKLLTYTLMEKNFFKMMLAFRLEARFALEVGGASHVALGHGTSALLWAGTGFPWFANLFLSKSERTQLTLSDPQSLGDLLRCRATAHYFGAKFENAENELNEAIPLLKRCGDHFTLLNATHVLRHARAYSNTSGGELRAAREVLALAKLVGNAQSICWGNYDIANALARRGELSEAASYMKAALHSLSSERLYCTESIRGAVHGFVLLQCSEYDSARVVLERAWQIIIGKIQLYEFSLRGLPHLIESIAGPRFTDRNSVSGKPRLRSLLRWSRFIHVMYPVLRAPMLRACGRALWVLGKEKKAVQAFERSIRIAREHNLQTDLARALLDLTAVKKAKQSENRAEAVRLLRATEAVIPRAEAWLLGDHHDETVIAPEFDLQAWETTHGSISR